MAIFVTFFATNVSELLCLLSVSCPQPGPVTFLPVTLAVLPSLPSLSLSVACHSEQHYILLPNSTAPY